MLLIYVESLSSASNKYLQAVVMATGSAATLLRVHNSETFFVLSARGHRKGLCPFVHGTLFSVDKTAVRHGVKI